ncbi:MAG TPA: hypothetical protein VM118_14950 [Acidobacteriota bacterium]|nr:hypothetical protein [Acidobacteriota bacterium]
MLFSRRRGITKEKSVQTSVMDDDLRKLLWNIVLVLLFETEPPGKELRNEARLEAFTAKLWHRFLKETLDTLPRYWSQVRDYMRNWLFSCEWFAVYDFIEFAYSTFGDLDKEEFSEGINSVLESERAGYRFVAGKFIPLMDEQEGQAIEDAIRSAEPFPGVRTHLRNAVSIFSERKDPEYRSSVKESIDAVESLARIISGQTKDSLGKILPGLARDLGVHPALGKAFSCLYGYASDEGGVRHSLLDDQSRVGLTEAKFMLVASAAIVNFLIQKSQEVGIGHRGVKKSPPK